MNYSYKGIKITADSKEEAVDVIKRRCWLYHV